MDARQFGFRLKELREEAGLTQRGLAEKAGLSLRSVTHFENGTREPGLSTALALADALGVTCEALRQKARHRRPAKRGRPRKGK